MSEMKYTHSVKDAADIIGCGLTKAYEIFNSPDFPSFRIGKKLLVNHTDLMNWISKQIELNRQENERGKH